MEKASSSLQLLGTLFFAMALLYFLTYDRMWDSPLEAGTVVNWMLAGLAINLLAWGAGSMVKRNLRNKINSIELEKKELKAMIFDMERAAKVGKSERRQEGGEATDRESSAIKPRENIK